MSNNPPDVIVELSKDDAQTLYDDCQAAMQQLLITIDEQKDTARPEFIRKLVDLLEFKHRVRDAIVKGMKQ